VAAGLALVSALVVTPAWAGGGEALHPSRGSAFAPRVGDWEGTDKGFHASFELVANPHNHIYGAAGYGIYDLTTSAPAGCPAEPGRFVIAAMGTARGQLLVSRDGTFPFRQGRRLGALRGASSAKLSGNTGRPCLPRLLWRLHPARRFPVADGRWRITFADGERQSQEVTDGGRASSIGLPHVTSMCPSGPGPSAQGGTSVFIPANGRIDQTLRESGGARLRVVWSFTSRLAGSGRFIATAPRCAPGSLSFLARRVG
jgi:hypothetical protein